MAPKPSQLSQLISDFLRGVESSIFSDDLTSRFHVGMETQIQIDTSTGEPVYDGMTFKRRWSVESHDHGTYQKKHFRIPYDSWSNPNFDDPIIDWPIHREIESIGMSGWNWKEEKSLWVGFDFDAITGHAEGVGVGSEQLALITEKASRIPWVQTRRSTGGGGLHLYVYFHPDNAPISENHHVHAAVARTVLGMMEREAGFDFRAHMDVLGGNMWVWHRKINNENKGLSIITQNTVSGKFEDRIVYCPNLPTNWRDNIDVVTGKSTKVRVEGAGDEEDFEGHAAAQNKIPLDETHLDIEARIAEMGYSIIWVPDHHCWQTHTKAFEELVENYPDEYRGIFKTLSEGSDKGKPNCFAFPCENGSLRVTRFGKGASEHETWNQEPGEWTWTFFNTSASLREAAAVFGGVEEPNGRGWVFTDWDDVNDTVKSLDGSVFLEDDWRKMFLDQPRNILLTTNKKNELVIEMDKHKDDKAPKGWITKGRKYVKLVRGAKPVPFDVETDQSLDGLVRALVAPSGEFSGWAIKDETNQWVPNNKDNARSVLKSFNIENTDPMLGKLIMRSWRLVHVPFQPEYLGDRQWNRDAPQFAYAPGDRDGYHPHWDMVMSHCGQDLNEALLEDTWAKANGVRNGAEYLKLWVAAMLRDPYCKLPYLCFFGPQNSGKSVFHEAISLLMTKGVQLADEALKNRSGFNGELANSVLCVVEETDLSQSGTAYNRLKQWVTGEDILIHPKKIQPYQTRNTTHWCQCTNSRSACPIFPGDTRITMLYVPLLEHAEIPKDRLIQQLREEAPFFLRTLLDLKIPPAPGRLQIPVISNETKQEAEESVHNALDVFIHENCREVPGALTKMKDFFAAFQETLDSAQKYVWTYNKVVRNMKEREYFPVGKSLNNVSTLGNVLLTDPNPKENYGKAWVTHDGKLTRKID